MSEYQYYEFLAIDRPLDDRQQDEVRALSTRASITPTSFVNEYHWGDFRGDPGRMMERYYDAHLYLTNWGTHQLMLRLPRGLLDIDVAEDYCVGDQVTAWTTDEFLILDLSSLDEYGEFDYDTEVTLSALVGVRAELAAGDLRPLYLAWLSGYGAWERDEDVFDRDADDDLEPPVPPGLTALTAPQRALADFLRLDDSLLAIAAQASPPLAQTPDDPARLAAWVTTKLPLAEKDRLLQRLAEGHAASAQMELLRRFRDEHTTPVPTPPRRNVGDLLDAAARHRADLVRQAAARRAEEEARLESERARARERRLNDLARDVDAAWSRVEAMIATKKPGEYDAAVALLVDLQALAERNGRDSTFAERSLALRQRHARKPSLIQRLNRAGVKDARQRCVRHPAYASW